ncbi:MAG TPA: hypothetical protein VKA34_14465 [Balneolales bacterium]|nr:hypothetical protein [Balneolales bacterium]
MKKWNLTISILVISLFMIWACDSPTNNRSAFTPDRSISAHGGGRAPGESIETVGNKLSFPVIWSDGVEIPLRGTYGEDAFDGQSFTLNEQQWYVQNDPGNTWQAQSVSEENTDTYVTSIDWGDNLEAKSWSVGDQVRVEVVLYKDLGEANAMKAYYMQIEDPNVSGTAEVWGTNTQTYDSDSATVYSGVAKIIIQKLTTDRDHANVSWDGSKWTGDVDGPIVNSGVWETNEGPNGYSAEVNVQGKIIYGYNWKTNTVSSAGDYRITFLLDKNVPNVTCKTFLDLNTVIVPSTTNDPAAIIPLAEDGDDGSEMDGGVASVDSGDNLSYIDVRLTERNGSGRPGGNGGGGGGNGNGHGRNR